MLVGIIDYDILVKSLDSFTPKIEVMLCSGYHKARGDIVHLIMDNRDLRPYQKLYLWRDYMKQDKFDAFNFFSKDDRIEFHGKFFSNQLFVPIEEKFFNSTPDLTIYEPFEKKIKHTKMRRKQILSKLEFCSLRKNELGYGDKKKIEFYDYDLGSQEDLDKILEIIKERKEKNIFWSPVSFSKNIRCNSFQTAVQWAQQEDFSRDSRHPTNIYYLNSLELSEIKKVPDYSLKSRIFVYLTNKTRFKNQEEFDEEYIRCIDKISYCLAHGIKIAFTLPPTMKIDEENRPFRELIFWNVMRERDSLMNISKDNPLKWLKDFLKRHPEMTDKVTNNYKGLATLGDVWNYEL